MVEAESIGEVIPMLSEELGSPAFNDIPCDFWVVSVKRRGLISTAQTLQSNACAGPLPGTVRGAVCEVSSPQLSFRLFSVPFCSLLLS